MGCDIHLYVERRDHTKDTVEAKAPWVTADTWTDSEYEDGVKDVAYYDHYYTGRSYDLFAVLADVRNGRGFAGVKTGSGFNPISSPRGVPDDACPEYRDAVERWGADGHSHSHLTLAELLAYDWTQTTEHRGYVDVGQWARWKLRGKPESWAGGVGGDSTRILEEAQVSAAATATGVSMYDLVHGRGGAVEKVTAYCGGGRIYTDVRWTEPYYRSCSHFWSECVPRLLRLGRPDCVRLVFFFDN